MGSVKKYHPVKLTIGLIFKNPQIYNKTKNILIRNFGALDFQSQEIDFASTDYYREELGNGLIRVFLSFKKLIRADRLSTIKTITNKIEKKLSRDNKRQINIDPGYLDSSKLVLASTKDYIHRIYLAKGIFAEMTLYFEHKTFNPWKWTYADYRSAEYISIFNQIRELYQQQINR